MILAALLLATTAAALPEGEAYVFTLQGRGTDISKGGVVNGANDLTNDGSTLVRSGETGYAWTAFGFFGQPNDLCNRSCGGLLPGRQDPSQVKREHLASASHFFWAEFRPEPAEFGKVRFEVVWERWFTDDSGRSKRVGGDHRTVEMREGQVHVLDFVAVEPDAESYCQRNVVVQVEAGIHEAPALERARLGYDLWLRHTDASGRATTRRAKASGKQGEEITFEFAPLRFPTDARVPDDGDYVEASIRAQGSVRGRVRPDGSIELRLAATRWTSAQVSGTDVRGGIGEPGVKVFSVLPGETVSVPFPPSHGKYGVSPKVFRGETAWIEGEQFFAGHTDELIFTVTREK